MFQIIENSGISKVQQLIVTINHSIDLGEYKIGDLLPSVNQLSKDLNISRDTVFKAYSELRRRGKIESAPTKGYRVAESTLKVLLFLDLYSPFKDILYNSFIANLPENYHVDLGFHHYNFRIFETVILDSIGKYNAYVVMNFNNEKISEPLKRIDRNKLLIIDLGDYKNENYSFVIQDFGEMPYQCLVQARDLIKKYKKFCFVYPKDAVHPLITKQYFDKFCTENNINHKLITHISDNNIKKGDAFFVFQQKEVVDILKHAKNKGYKVGTDIGLIAYNDTPLYEVIESGITSVSTDFTLMGKRAADFVKSREKIKEIIPTRLNIRGSL